MRADSGPWGASRVSTEVPEEPFTDASSTGSHHEFDSGPLGSLPRLSRRQTRLEGRLARLANNRACLLSLSWLEGPLGSSPGIDRAELLWRASGLQRPGLVAQFSWPSLKTRLALGIETPLAHAIVDSLLGFERTDAESRLQLTPVEWGVLTFVVARSLAELSRGACPIGSWDLYLDRVGPDPFVPGDLGAIVTLRWSVRVGPVTGSVRLWVSESQFTHWLEAAPDHPDPGPVSGPRFDELTGTWRALAGTVAMPRGLGRLRLGGVLPMDDSPLRGTPQSPVGDLSLELVLAGRAVRYRFPAEAVPMSGGGRIIVTSTLQAGQIPREALPVIPPSEPGPAPDPAGLAAADLPVTLTVELGRVNLTLGRLADLRPGDVVELARHSREPVELTSGGRLVARGELVQIDTELGVRVTHVFL
jgi:type III secretion system YscQ/HrcQ family protein